MLNLAISPCPNDIFCYSSLINQEIEHPYQISVMELSELNRFATLNMFAFSKMSAWQFIQLPESYTLTQVGSSHASKGGPYLVYNSKASTPCIGLKFEVAVPSLESTAAAVVQKYFPSAKLTAYPLADIPIRLQKQQSAYAIIINEAIHDLDFCFGFKSLSLSKLWFEKTSFSLPLGLVAAKKSLTKTQISTFESTVQRSISWSQRYPEKALSICREYSHSDSDLSNLTHIKNYTESAYYNSDLPYNINHFKHFFQSI